MSRASASGASADEINEEVERLKLDCQHALGLLRLAAMVPNIKSMEEHAQRVVELTRDPRLPADANRQTIGELKALELLGYQKATDHALRKAMDYGLEHKVAEKRRALAVAQSFFSKALSRGATDEFKKATEMALEVAQLTGEHKQQGPTRAKPAEEAPTVVARGAKNELRGAKRYADPVLAVKVSGDSFQTVNWSVSGMLLDECEVPDIEPGQEHTITVQMASAAPLTLPIRIVRVYPDKRRVSVTYCEPYPPEVRAFFRKLVLSKAPASPAA
jgi:hypothetical protein